MNTSMPPPLTGEERSRLADPARLRALRETGLLESAPAEIFERATRLATRVTGVPVSLVSMVDENRQVFVAQTGLDAPAPSETPLSHSFCRYVVESDAPLNVPDAREDTVLRDNGAVRDVGVTAYLGVPLRTIDGQPLGAFCLIDREARQWTEEEYEALSDIAAGVEAEIRLRRQINVAHREENRFRAVLDQMPIGVGVAELGTGRLLDLNATAIEMFGMQDGDVTKQLAFDAYTPEGRKLSLSEFPIVRAARNEETISHMELRCVRHDGPERNLLVSAQRVESEPPVAVATALDISDLNAAREHAAEVDRRLAHFHEITFDAIVELDSEDKIRFANSVMRARIRDAVGAEAEAQAVGRSLWETAPHLIGSNFEKALEEARRTGVPTVTDQDGRDGRILEARLYPEHGAIIAYLRDVTEERQIAKARDTLTRELNHRVKNAFAMMSGLVGMTARHAKTPEEMARGLRERIGALARAHELINPTATPERDFRGMVELRELLLGVLSPYTNLDDPRLILDGPDIALNHAGSTNLALVIHELATNAVKYGALSHDAGLLELTWRNTSGQLELDWRESGYPEELVPPSNSGFGSKLIDLTIQGQLRGTYGTEWVPDGFQARMTVPMDLIKG
ncbi:GAF domain-containing protein [Thioclava sp. F36-7]|uniref:GAF domain-containing protein n=1 Tax=Thioclava sp. F36-7 TaxID=1915317 RepID=UPI0009968DBD|nr:GAF domain-containing protein [Thioclava sp. F36-7]